VKGVEMLFPDFCQTRKQKLRLYLFR